MDNKFALIAAKIKMETIAQLVLFNFITNPTISPIQLFVTYFFLRGLGPSFFVFLCFFKEAAT
jgi:hypothetical protein